MKLTHITTNQWMLLIILFVSEKNCNQRDVSTKHSLTTCPTLGTLEPTVWSGNKAQTRNLKAALTKVGSVVARNLLNQIEYQEGP